MGWGAADNGGRGERNQTLPEGGGGKKIFHLINFLREASLFMGWEREITGLGGW